MQHVGYSARWSYGYDLRRYYHHSFSAGEEGGFLGDDGGESDAWRDIFESGGGGRGGGGCGGAGVHWEKDG